MSNDLISRKELIKRMELAKIGAKSIEEQFFFDGVMSIIDTQETAFDKQKVIEQIIEESHAENLEFQGTSGETYYHYIETIIETEDVIKIIEKGGIESDRDDEKKM